MLNTMLAVLVMAVLLATACVRPLIILRRGSGYQLIVIVIVTNRAKPMSMAPNIDTGQTTPLARRAPLAELSSWLGAQSRQSHDHWRRRRLQAPMLTIGATQGSSPALDAGVARACSSQRKFSSARFNHVASRLDQQGRVCGRSSHHDMEVLVCERKTRRGQAARAS